MNSNSTKNQDGNTGIGIIAGILLGLAGALAVAVYVTKSPAPFNKNVNPNLISDSQSEAEKNKEWDPNSVLYGKNPAIPTPIPAELSVTTPAFIPNTDANTTIAGPILAPTPEVVTASGTNLAIAKPKAIVIKKSTPQTPTSVPLVSGSTNTLDVSNAPTLLPSTAATTDANSDPLAELLQLKPDQQRNPNTVSVQSQTEKIARKSSNFNTESFIYYVQAGAFGESESAQHQRDRLTMLGMDVKISERDQGGRTIYRVRSGPFRTDAEAQAMHDKINASGSDAAVIRVQR